MNKKMKRVVFDSSPHVSYVDARARLKHQTLLQDYLELQQETEAARNKLDSMKQKKLTLQAEVRFLRQRYKFLLKCKTSTQQQEQVATKPQNVETARYRKSKKEKICSEKETTLHSKPPIYKLNQKGRVYTEKKKALSSVPPPVFDLNKKVNSRAAKEQSETIGNNSSPMFDLNQNEATFSGKERRAPIFDLNQISRDEEELQEGFESFEEQRQHNDLKLSVCRNIGDASTSRPGKRKISWQDPVALRV